MYKKKRDKPRSENFVFTTPHHKTIEQILVPNLIDSFWRGPQ
jgi:hypothetical protein